MKIILCKNVTNANSRATYKLNQNFKDINEFI